MTEHGQGRLSPGKRAVFAALAMLLGLTLVLAAGETGLRLYSGLRDRLACRQIARLSPEPGLGYEPIPGTNCGLYAINSLGFRGPEIAVEKPAGVRRLAVLGDSIAFGAFLPEPAILPSLLGQALNREGRGADRWEVVNASMGGWGLGQYLARYRRDVRPLRPDLVLVSLCQNDAVDMGPYLLDIWGVIRERRQHEAPPGPPLVRHTLLYRKLHNWLADRRLSPAGGADQLARAKAPRLSDDWPRARAGLDALIQELRADQVEVVFLIFPYRFQLAEPGEVCDPVVSDYLARQGVPLVDVLAAFKAQGQDIFIANDYLHPNALGHIVAAQMVARQLARTPAAIPPAGGTGRGAGQGDGE